MRYSCKYIALHEMRNFHFIGRTCSLLLRAFVCVWSNLESVGSSEMYGGWHPGAEGKRTLVSCNTSLQWWMLGSFQEQATRVPCVIRIDVNCIMPDTLDVWFGGIRSELDKSYLVCSQQAYSADRGTIFGRSRRPIRKLHMKSMYIPL
jgi:hypothetical protein